ncbi:hypothetical protein C8R43DRAFT_1125647 [Mycena crocata]|nr:hypothetical protein C8R43DRAFT_1125647 [Mycena crocata]
MGPFKCLLLLLFCFRDFFSATSHSIPCLVMTSSTGVSNGNWDPFWDAVTLLPQPRYDWSSTFMDLGRSLEFEMYAIRETPYNRSPRWAEILTPLGFGQLLRLALRAPWLMRAVAEHASVVMQRVSRNSPIWIVHSGSSSGVVVPASLVSADLLGELAFETCTEICAYLNLRERAQLAQTSHRNRCICAAALQSAVDDVLRLFGLQPVQIRLLQAGTMSVIGGEILDFLMIHPPADLTDDSVSRLLLYVPQHQWYWPGCYFDRYTSFKEPEGVGASPTADEGQESCVASTRLLMNAARKEILLVRSCSGNALDPVVCSPYSPRIGGLTHMGLWHGHPASTIGRLALPNAAYVDVSYSLARQYSLTWVRRLQAAGYLLLSFYPFRHTCGSSMACPASMRSSRDAGCLESFFYPGIRIGVDASVYPTDYVVHWTLGGRVCPNLGTGIEDFAHDRRYAYWKVRWEALVAAAKSYKTTVLS